MRVLALDIGEKRVGVAYATTDFKVAIPLEVVAASEVENRGPAFRRIMEDHEPDMILAGLPLSMSGERGKQAKRVEAIAQAVASSYDLPLVFVDERLSSSQAKRILHEQGMTERQMRGKLDCVAASLFLQAWLDGQAKPAIGEL